MFQCCENNKSTCQFFVGLFSAFLIVSILFVGALTLNKIKEGKYIGSETKNTITVSDTGTIYTKPDLALISASVISEAKTVGEAMSDNTKKMNDIITGMKKEGVEDKDLKTTNFSVFPRYEYEGKDCNTYYCPPGNRILVGYEVNQSLQIKIRNMEKIGILIEEATEAGANQMSDLQFTVDKEDEVKKQARDLAIEKAKNKAIDLARNLGVSLIKITNFTESSVLPYYFGLEKAALGMGGGAETPQIATGENKVEVTVMITYEIR